MVVKRVEMSQTAAAFGDDKLLIFLFIVLPPECVVFVVACLVSSVQRFISLGDTCPTVQHGNATALRRVNNNRCGSSWRGKFESCHSSSGPKCPGQSYFTNSALCD
ncbi:hypothetical protein T09_8025 [Trichinella sp. T9]|uniref:Uncharacterized protein n=1 Tax=Trichinella murrelli TaxID=144512 RepID=A0A0V0U297_9BILA|nr:hypothetical protein T05_16369 [Trichinella murrelli]KRX58792.1 hypothetical protein T09_8025 [Trichinella sp. T9]KRZ97311.1 hypothetical protein T08_1695 [Trichinella sp. T8]